MATTAREEKSVGFRIPPNNQGPAQWSAEHHLRPEVAFWGRGAFYWAGKASDDCESSAGHAFITALSFVCSLAIWYQAGAGGLGSLCVARYRLVGM